MSQPCFFDDLTEVFYGVNESAGACCDNLGRQRQMGKKKIPSQEYGACTGQQDGGENHCDAFDMGIKYLTVYAFSTENWRRPKDEVDALMKLLRDYLKTCIKRANKNNMRVRVIGDVTGLSEDLREKIEQLEEASKGNTGINFTIALNYGSRDEMIRAMKKMAGDLLAGTLKKEEITEDLFAGYLDTKGLPEPDLMIRTSGEQRLSNFMLWQLAYTEFYFTDVLWPDFNKKELKKAVEYYNGRERRFGGI